MLANYRQVGALKTRLAIILFINHDNICIFFQSHKDRGRFFQAFSLFLFAVCFLALRQAFLVGGYAAGLVFFLLVRFHLWGFVFVLCLRYTKP